MGSAPKETFLGCRLPLRVGRELFHYCLPLSLLQGIPEVFEWQGDPRSMVKVERKGSGAELEEGWLPSVVGTWCTSLRVCFILSYFKGGEKSSLLFPDREEQNIVWKEIRLETKEHFSHPRISSPKLERVLAFHGWLERMFSVLEVLIGMLSQYCLTPETHLCFL